MNYKYSSNWIINKKKKNTYLKGVGQGDSGNESERLNTKGTARKHCTTVTNLPPPPSTGWQFQCCYPYILQLNS